MIRRFKMNQGVLAYIYEDAQGRMDFNPEVAKKHHKTIEEYPFYTSENDAIQVALDIQKKEHRGCQIWAKIGKDEEYFYIQDYFIATNDNRIKQAAEYIGMALIAKI